MTAGLAAVSWWAEGLAESTAAIVKAARIGDEAMVEWWHEPEGGGRMHIQVIRDDFDTLQEYLAEIAAMQAAFPPVSDPPTPPEGDD